MIVVNCRTRSAAATGLSGHSSSSSETSTALSLCSRSSRARCVRISSDVNMRLTLGNKSRKLSGEFGMLGGSAGKIHELLTHYIIERRRDSISGLDRSSGFALVNPNFVVGACTPRLAFVSIMSSAPGRRPSALNLTRNFPGSVRRCGCHRGRPCDVAEPESPAHRAMPIRDSTAPQAAAAAGGGGFRDGPIPEVSLHAKGPIRLYGRPRIG